MSLDDTAGTIDDNLPFFPTGLQIASTAWRTWIYSDVGPKRTRFGYLRVGQRVDARGPVTKNAGCTGGWYRINPRGFVCIGLGATLALDSALLEMASVRPFRRQGLPYLYVRASEPPPLLYHRLPTYSEAMALEGDRAGRIAIWKERLLLPEFTRIREAREPVPGFVMSGEGEQTKRLDLVKPYGVKKPIRYRLHAGRATSGSGFSLQRVFEGDKRVYGLTTEHDLIALDNTTPGVESSFQGVEFADGESLPVGFVKLPMVTVFEVGPKGGLIAKGEVPKRTAVKLVGQKRRGQYQVVGGGLVAADALLVVEPRTSFPSFATGARKWIDVSISSQVLVAYVGQKPVFATLVSTGRGGMGDPEKTFATVRGTFMIHSKHVTATMDGSSDRSDSYELRDVPFVQYFHKGYALHGVYWHDDFGRTKSHGCINLSPRDAAWLFEWTDPEVPDHWHSVLNLQRGTVVMVRP